MYMVIVKLAQEDEACQVCIDRAIETKSVFVDTLRGQMKNGKRTMSQDRVQVFRIQFAKEFSASSPEKAHYLDY